MTPSQRLAAVYRIPDLAWETGATGGLTCLTIHGRYWIIDNGEGKKVLIFTPMNHAEFPKRFNDETEDGCKAAANLHNRSVIASALEPASSQSVEEAVERELTDVDKADLRELLDAWGSTERLDEDLEGYIQTLREIFIQRPIKLLRMNLETGELEPLE